MSPKANRKRRKGVTDQGDLTGRVESLENVSKASQDNNPHQLRSKKHQGSTVKEIGATLEAVVPLDHIVGVEDAKPAVESSVIKSTSSPTHSGEQANVITTEVTASGAV